MAKRGVRLDTWLVGSGAITAEGINDTIWLSLFDQGKELPCDSAIAS